MNAETIGFILYMVGGLGYVAVVVFSYGKWGMNVESVAAFFSFLLFSLLLSFGLSISGISSFWGIPLILFLAIVGNLLASTWDM